MNSIKSHNINTRVHIIIQMFRALSRTFSTSIRAQGWTTYTSLGYGVSVNEKEVDKINKLVHETIKDKHQGIMNDAMKLVLKKRYEKSLRKLGFNDTIRIFFDKSNLETNEYGHLITVGDLKDDYTSIAFNCDSMIGPLNPSHKKDLQNIFRVNYYYRDGDYQYENLPFDKYEKYDPAIKKFLEMSGLPELKRGFYLLLD